MKQYRIEEICEVVSGGTPSTKVANYWEGDILWLTPKDLSSNATKWIYNSSSKITKAGLDNSAARMLPINTVLLSSRAPIGYLALVGKPLCTNQGFKSMICNSNYVLPEYLYYYLQTKVEELNSISTGSTFKELSGSLLKNYVVNLHDITTQQHIVDILGTLDEKIEYYDKLIKSLEHDGELIFKIFIENKTQSKERICLSDIATFYNGYSYSGEELCDQSEEALVTIKNFDRNGGFKVEGFKPIRITGKIKPSMYVELGDLLVAHTDLTQNADIIGNPIILFNLGQYNKAAISMDLVKVESSRLSKELLYYILKSPDFKAHALGYCSGTTVLHLNKKALQEYEFDLPIDNSLIDTISGKLRVIFERIQNAFLESQKLTQLKQLYLQKFFG